MGDGGPHLLDESEIFCAMLELEEAECEREGTAGIVLVHNPEKYPTLEKSYKLGDS